MAGVEELPAPARNLNIAKHVEQQASIQAHPAEMYEGNIFAGRWKSPWTRLHMASWEWILLQTPSTIESFGTQTLLWNPDRKRPSEILLRDTHMGHSILALQTLYANTPETLSETLFWDILVGCSCRTLFEDTPPGHYCKRLLWSTHVRQSYTTLRVDTIAKHWLKTLYWNWNTRNIQWDTLLRGSSLDTLVKRLFWDHSLETLWWHNAVKHISRHSCSTLLQNTPLRHSCSTLSKTEKR